MINEIIQGDALIKLRELESESIDCCITSPPYYNLRDYKTEGQIGLEATAADYIQKLIEIFSEVKRVLKSTASCWINMGDSYDGNKSLCLIPERFATAMIDQGWILRNKIIWYKPNCMPSSARDRFTVDWEYLYFFTKSPRYYFETQYEPLDWAENLSGWQKQRIAGIDTNKYNIENGKSWQGTLEDGRQPQSFHKPLASFGGNKAAGYENPTYSGNEWNPNGLGRIKRCVWKISTQPFSDAHFAVFPPAIVETPLKATCPIDGLVLDPFIGSGTVGLVALQNARNFVGIELNPEYIKMALERLDPYLKQQRITEFADA